MSARRPGRAATRRTRANAGRARTSGARGSRPPAARPARTLEIRPLAPDRWPDLVALFGPRGACAGCWCMWWRLRGAAFTRGKGESNRRAFKRVVEAGPPPGLLAYQGGEPIAWCALAPREVYPRLEHSRTLARLDGEPVWALTCFFVARPFRRRGVTVRLLEAAVRYAASRGARIVEGYPVEARAGKMLPDAWAWTGFPSAFRKAGFVEVARRSRTRPIMRWRAPRPRGATDASGARRFRSGAAGLAVRPR